MEVVRSNCAADFCNENDCGIQRLFHDIKNFNHANVEFKKATGTEIESVGSEPSAGTDEGSEKMSLVDWRWAAEKGFWSRERHCWIEETGGKAAFLLQRAMKCRKRPKSTDNTSRNLKAICMRMDLMPWSNPSAVDEINHHNATCGDKRANAFLRRFWAPAYRPHDVIRLLKQLPPRLCCILDQRLQQLWNDHDSVARRSQPFRPPEQEGGGAFDTICAAAREQVMAAEPAIWDEDGSGSGFLAFDFAPDAVSDGVAMEQPTVTINRRAAALLGLPHADTAALLARGAAAAAVPDLDLVRLLLADLDRPADDDAAPCHFRVVVGTPPGAAGGVDQSAADRADGDGRGGGEGWRAQLVRCVGRRRFDSCGRITQVRGPDRLCVCVCVCVCACVCVYVRACVEDCCRLGAHTRAARGSMRARAESIFTLHGGGSHRQRRRWSQRPRAQHSGGGSGAAQAAALRQ